MRDIKREADRYGYVVHFARLFQIIGVKNSESSDKSCWKWKGRVIIQGNNIKTQNHDAAVFDDLSSSGSLMSASKLLDIIGHFPGFGQAQADAVSAYTQAPYKGPPCWLLVPPERWPPSWFNKDGTAKYKCPCVKLLVALYGHPSSGALWEMRCTDALKKCGFINILDWDCCFMHPKLRLVLSVYVDDFKLSGPLENLEKRLGPHKETFSA